MLCSMITLNKDQALADQIGNLSVECIVGTEDGEFVVYLDKIANELILCGHWVLIAGDDDIPAHAFRPRPVFGGGKSLKEASEPLIKIYGKNFWRRCRILYLRMFGCLEEQLFKEWKRLGLADFDAERNHFCNNTPRQIQTSYLRFLKEN